MLREGRDGGVLIRRIRWEGGSDGARRWRGRLGVVKASVIPLFVTFEKNARTRRTLQNPLANDQWMPTLMLDYLVHRLGIRHTRPAHPYHRGKPWEKQVQRRAAERRGARLIEIMSKPTRLNQAMYR